MNAMKYEILTIVHNSTSMCPVHRTDLLSDPSVISQRDKCIKELITSGYLSQPVCSDILRITPSGISVLEAEDERIRKEESIRQEQIHREQQQEQQRAQEILRAKDERASERTAEHRFQVKLSLGNTVFGILLGAVIGNLDRLIPWIISLFG